MEKLKELVNILLHEYDCIIIPGFGALVAAHETSILDEDKQLIYPPSKKIAFNPQLDKNDALLIHNYTKHFKVPYDEAAKNIHTEVENWIKLLKSSKELIIENVGSFKSDAENKIIFKAFGNYNFLPDSYGMTEVAAKPLDQSVSDNKIKKLDSLTKDISESEPKVKKTAGFRISKYAATVSALILLSLSLYFLPDDAIQLNLGTFSPFQKSLPVTSHYIVKNETKTPVNNEVIVNNVSDSPEILNVQTKNYYIIGGSFSQKDNALRFSNELNNKGFTSEVLETDFGMFRVTYKSFNEEADAELHLQMIKKSENASAWILEEEI